MRYDNLITQAEGQALLLSMMTRDGKSAMQTIKVALSRFAMDNNVPSVALFTAEDFIEKTRKMTFSDRAVLSAVFAILLEAGA